MRLPLPNVSWFPARTGVDFTVGFGVDVLPVRMLWLLPLRVAGLML